MINRKYKIDETYFDAIDTPEKAYFLGLLYADGSVYRTKCSIGLIDEDVLLSLRDRIYPDKDYTLYRTPPGKKFFPLRNKIYNVQEAFHFSFYSQPMVNALLSHGCMERKTTKIRFPASSIDTEYYSDFVRGYFDGDGSVNKRIDTRRGTYTYYRVSIASRNSDFADDLVCLLKDFGAAKYLHDGIFTVDISNLVQIIRFSEFIYSHAGPHLRRKRDIFEEAKAMRADKATLRLANKTSEFDGVWQGEYAFQSELVCNGERIYLGSYQDAEAAAIAYHWAKEFYQAA